MKKKKKKIFMQHMAAVLAITFLLTTMSYQKVCAANPFQNGQCTWWAYERWTQLLGYSPSVISGDAKAWYDNAESAGYEKGATPRKGAIVCWSGGTYGHVAVVEEVYVDHITISEYNWPVGSGYKSVDLYDTNRDYGLKGYIYLPGTTVPTVSPLPEGAPRTVSDGEYHIVSALGGTNLDPGKQCVTIGGLPGELNVNAANMLIWPSIDWNDSVVTITWLGNGFYKIKIKNADNKCLDAAWGETTQGTNVQQYEDNGTFSQQWQIDEISGGNGYAIRSRCSGLYLDVDGGSADNGTNVQLWDGNGTDAQRWYLIPWRGGSSAKQEMPDGDYEIVPKGEPDKALATKEEGKTNGTNVELDSRGSDGKHTFRVTWLGNGYYQIVDNNSKLSLDVFGGRSLRGTNLQVTNPHFKWGFNFSPSRGYYWFRQRRDSAVPLLLVALHSRAHYFLPSSNLSFSSCSCIYFRTVSSFTFPTVET